MFDWYHYTDYGAKKDISKNTVLYREGDCLDGFYYLSKGHIAISVLREDGYERIVDFVYPGTIIGERMINNLPSYTNATVLEDSTLYFFSTEQFELLRKNHPEVSYQFVLTLISKIRFMANINTIINASVDIQLAQFLLHFADNNNRVKISQTAISKYIGKSRVSIWKVLKKWREDKTIEVYRECIVIKKKEILHSLIE